MSDKLDHEKDSLTYDRKIYYKNEIARMQNDFETKILSEQNRIYLLWRLNQIKTNNGEIYK